MPSLNRTRNSEKGCCTTIMVGDTLFVLLDIEKEEEASDKVEREDGSTIIMGDHRLRSLRLLNQQLRIFAAVGDACLR